jgi:hypothetical protein
MSADTPIYRLVCSRCTRPAVTLDSGGDPACGGHADEIRKAPDRPDEFGHGPEDALH